MAVAATYAISADARCLAMRWPLTAFSTLTLATDGRASCLLASRFFRSRAMLASGTTAAVWCRSGRQPGKESELVATAHETRFVEVDPFESECRPVDPNHA